MLRRLIVVCSDCHRTTHVGYAQVKGEERQAFDHLVAVTGMTADQAGAHLDNAFATWRRRSARDWHLDLTVLTTVGIALARPPEAGKRRDVAARRLNPGRSLRR